MGCSSPQLVFFPEKGKMSVACGTCEGCIIKHKEYLAQMRLKFFQLMGGNYVKKTRNRS
ncbi:MAG: hypothetical protein [Microviridae sp. ctKAt32]|nr:MAG: hypothetical protein [Microviridae sp. ctKAt32]